MPRLPENVQGVLGLLVGLIGGIILILLISVGLFQESFQWETVWLMLIGGAIAGPVGIMARTHPRLRAALWAGGWAVLVAGLTWIITAFISLTFFGPWLGRETLIPPLIAALITCGGFYRWYQRPLLTTATSSPASKS